MCTAHKSCPIPPSFVNCENRGTRARSASETGRDLARGRRPRGIRAMRTGAAIVGGNERLARDAIKFRAGCARDGHPRNLMKRVRASSVALGDRAFGHARRREARVAREFHQTKGGSLEKKCRGSRRSPSTEDDGLARRDACLLAFARPSARSVVRTAMSADDASIVTRPLTWRRVTSLRRGGVNPPRRGLFSLIALRGRIGGLRLVKNTASHP